MARAAATSAPYPSPWPRPRTHTHSHTQVGPEWNWNNFDFFIVILSMPNGPMTMISTGGDSQVSWDGHACRSQTRAIQPACFYSSLLQSINTKALRTFRPWVRKSASTRGR